MWVRLSLSSNGLKKDRLPLFPDAFERLVVGFTVYELTGTAVALNPVAASRVPGLAALPNGPTTEATTCVLRHYSSPPFRVVLSTCIVCRKPVSGDINFDTF